jgi:hypothetical protein
MRQTAPGRMSSQGRRHDGRFQGVLHLRWLFRLSPWVTWVVLASEKTVTEKDARQVLMRVKTPTRSRTCTAPASQSSVDHPAVSTHTSDPRGGGGGKAGDAKREGARETRNLYNTNTLEGGHCEVERDLRMKTLITRRSSTRSQDTARRRGIYFSWVT